MLNMDSFTNIDGRAIWRRFSTAPTTPSGILRQSEDSRYVGLCLPHILMRLPYGKDNKSVDTSITKRLSTAPITPNIFGGMPPMRWRPADGAFAMYGWCACIRGVERRRTGGRPSDPQFHNRRSDVAVKCPTEAPLRTARKKSWRTWDSFRWVHCKGTDYAAFFSVQSSQKQKMYNTEAANANARLSTQLPIFSRSPASLITSSQ